MQKTATSFFQEVVFKELSNYSRYKYISTHQTRKMIKLVPSGTIEFKSQYINLKNLKKFSLRNKIISQEDLIGANPRYWEKHSEINKKIFGYNNKIFITIRKPSDYVYSKYIQLTKDYNFISLNNFLNNYFSLNHFDYRKLIYFYKIRFKSVKILKFENLFDESKLSSILEINFSSIKNFKKNNLAFVSKNKSNVSLSEFSYNLNRGLNKFFLNLNCSLKDYNNKVNSIRSKNKFYNILLKNLNTFNFSNNIDLVLRKFRIYNKPKLKLSKDDKQKLKKLDYIYNNCISD
jgi:hypothetical protein